MPAGDAGGRCHAGPTTTARRADRRAEAVVALMLPSTVFALEQMSDQAMEQITGQAGVAIAVDDVKIYQSIGGLSYTDTDGTDGTAGTVSIDELTVMIHANAITSLDAATGTPVSLGHRASRGPMKEGFMIGHRWFWTILVIVVLAVVSPAAGQLRLLEDETLANTYAGTTLAVWRPDVDIGMGFDSLAYIDPDGTGDGRPGSLILEGFTLTGAMRMQTPLSMHMGGFLSLISGKPQTGIDFSVDGLILSFDRLSIDAIRVGYGTGPGESFGAITLTNWVTQISGRIQVYSY